jgi:putative oxidoreductase
MQLFLTLLINYQMANLPKNILLLRIAVAIILFVHSIPGIFNNGINDFGNYYLNEKGFSPVGIPVAWAIKLSHIACAICLLWGQFIKLACGITIFILLTGIIMVHFKEGWFVVGGGRNGMEYNFLLIIVLITIMLPDSIYRKNT